MSACLIYFENMLTSYDFTLRRTKWGIMHASKRNFDIPARGHTPGIWLVNLPTGNRNLVSKAVLRMENLKPHSRDNEEREQIDLISWLQFLAISQPCWWFLIEIIAQIEKLEDLITSAVIFFLLLRVLLTFCVKLWNVIYTFRFSWLPILKSFHLHVNGSFVTICFEWLNFS